MIFRFLASYHYHRGTDLQAVFDAYSGTCQAFADSGAFSAYTCGAQIALADYAAWLCEWDRLLPVKVTLDVIGDHEATMRNTRALEDKGISVLPVFHPGTPWEELEKLCAAYDYVALGGMVPHAANREGVLRWLVRCFKIAQQTGTVFHGLGQLSPTTLLSLPFYSADSSSWGQGVRFGKLTLWDPRARALVLIRAGDAMAATRHAALLRAHGADPARVARPGFAMASRRSTQTYIQENAMMRGVSALAFLRMGEYMQRRHGVTPPASVPGASPGTVVYLADGSEQQIRVAAMYLSAHVPSRMP